MPGMEERSKVWGRLVFDALAGKSSRLQNAELLNAPIMSAGGLNGCSGVLGLVENRGSGLIKRGLVCFNSPNFS